MDNHSFTRSDWILLFEVLHQSSKLHNELAKLQDDGKQQISTHNPVLQEFIESTDRTNAAFWFRLGLKAGKEFETNTQ